jgi:predicted RNase H-like HicB family nuclease
MKNEIMTIEYLYDDNCYVATSLLYKDIRTHGETVVEAMFNMFNAHGVIADELQKEKEVKQKIESYLKKLGIEL